MTWAPLRAQRLDDLDMRLRRAFNQQLINQRERLARLDARLAAQHPGRNLALLPPKNYELMLPNCQPETEHNSKCSSAYCA